MNTGHIPRQDPPEPEWPVVRHYYQVDPVPEDAVWMVAPHGAPPGFELSRAHDPVTGQYLGTRLTRLPLRSRLAARFWDALAAFDRWLYWTWGRGSEGWRRK